MANIVDFSNAVITVGTANPTAVSYLGTNASSYLYDSTGTSRIGSGTKTNRSYDEGTITYYNGTFSSSGTSFYICGDSSSTCYWLVSGVSFESGDVYGFSISVVLPEPAEESD